ncbi:MAG: sulfatase [Planctomycetales bacterium]|nr:sulfatase [Planctomycetales bacterium]
MPTAPQDISCSSRSIGPTGLGSALTTWLACLAATALAADPPETLAEAPQLNVLMVCVDDMRADAGCYGHPQALTPHLDRLAARGMRFERAYCQQALCNPSRASLLTGRTPDSLQIWNLTKGLRSSDPNLITLPQLFRQHGYHTRGIGKVYHNWRTADHGDPQSWSVPAVLHFARHDDDTPQVKGPLPPNESTAPRCMRLDVPDEAYFDGRIAKLAVEELQARGKDRKPFFLAVGFWKPHLPFNPPKKYWELYERPATPKSAAKSSRPLIDMPANPLAPKHVPALALHDSREIMRAAGDDGLTADEVLELRHGYLAGISFLDAQLGKILDELERQKLDQQTIIVFWSDHGFHLGEHSLWCKTSNFELDARVPLILSVPPTLTRTPPGGGVRWQAQGASQALVELLDLYPTLAELCRLPAPPGLDGDSMVELLQSERSDNDSRWSAAYTQHPRPNYYGNRPEAMGVSVRTARHRYTEWRDFATKQVLATELYDHRQDPRETDNLAAVADAATLAELRAALERRFPRE